MNITCISSSNIKHSKDKSTSLIISNIIKQEVESEYPGNINNIIDLRDYEFIPCDGCGKCFTLDDKCIKNDSYNKISGLINNSDILFIVSPHYAPIPAKLVMLLEKLEQNAFLKRFNNENYRSRLINKPLGIIGHGGGTKEIAQWYEGVILESIANALSYPIEMKICGFNEEYKNGLIVSADEVVKDENQIFPVQKYNWIDIRKDLKKYIKIVLSQIKYNRDDS
jgi:multimeric flavodoxin WrbA